MIIFLRVYLFNCVKRENDVAGIDVNMGCPKDYSVKVNKIILNSLVQLSGANKFGS